MVRWHHQLDGHELEQLWEIVKDREAWGAAVHGSHIYRYESWTIKKGEHQRIDAFQLWCWRGLLRVPWTIRRSKQSIPKEINPEYSLEGQTLKLKLQ